MNGAESLVKTLLASGIRTCFANPGTSEMHFVAALDRVPGMKCVLGLTESVVTGAADGYGRMSDEPAATLLHCGPGLANGLSNLHNARRAQTPVVNIVGDQATYHRPLDPALAADALQSGPNPLTPRERDVLAAAIDGASIIDIAARLALSESTVRNYLSTAIHKTGTHNKIEAAIAARDNGWL